MIYYSINLSGEIVGNFCFHRVRLPGFFISEILKILLKEKLNKILPKSAIGQAIAYTLTLWPRLVRYIDQGRFYIDNNLIENSIRPVALGRKNYMFAGSHDAAQQAAILYSLLATCKINNVEPFEWLSNYLSVIFEHPGNQLHKLLPGKKQAPSHC